MKNILANIKNIYLKHRWIRFVLCVALIIGVLAIVVPFVFSSGYTYLCEDDFSFEGGGRDSAEHYGQIKGAFIRANRYYMTNQGTYFSNFIWHLVRPYLRWGMPGFHAVMIANILVFIVSLSLAIKTLCKDTLYSLSIIFLTFFALLGISGNFGLMELLFWYTGTVNFTWVLSFSLLTLVLQLKIKAETCPKKQWLYAGISIITGLIGSGGALLITAAQCAFLLLVLLLSYEDIKKSKLIIVPFLSAFTGALWNTCAPGNFARIASSEQSYGVLDAIRDTIIDWKTHISSLMHMPLFILLLAFVFISTMISNKKIIAKGITHLKLITVCLGMLMTQFLTAFPAVLGYQGSLYNQRTSSTFDLIIKITFIFGVMCFAQWCTEHLKYINKILPVFVCIVLLFGFVHKNEVITCIKDGYSYTLSKELYSGTIRDVYKVREATLSQIESAKDGTDVVVYANSIPSNKSMYGMGLLDDPNAFVNSQAAGMFKVNSITVFYE